jgi:hypothetical protein
MAMVTDAALVTFLTIPGLKGQTPGNFKWAAACAQVGRLTIPTVHKSVH